MKILINGRSGFIFVIGLSVEKQIKVVTADSPLRKAI